MTVTPKSDSALDPYLILKATYDSGVSVAEMEITATGTIEQVSGALQLRLNAKQSFEIVPNSPAEKLSADKPGATAARVTVRGFLYRKPAGGGKAKMPTGNLKLEITEVKNAP
ncbi:MAG: hypothetical protein EXQ56_12065 [Acidobacteria bacterium]|nr:hypothetical protein [Acidobacteriota bacterium]